MKRSLKGAVAALAICSAVPALAADYPELRPAYPETWENPDDSIRFEFGTAYWYSWGEQDADFTARSGGVTLGDVNITSRDNTHIGELHGKIEDLSTQTYLSGIAGIGLNTTGNYSISTDTAPASSGAIGPRSAIGYAGADFGWLPFGTIQEGAAFGGFVGYHYWKDAPDIGTGRYAATIGGGPPAAPTSLLEAKDNLDIHALRLGLKGSADFQMFDIQAEVAAVPYAQITGLVGGSATIGGGGFDLVGGPYYERQPTSLSGRGYGVMAEGMVGFHPTENLAIRVGGRAWYLEGQLDAVFKAHNNPDLTLPSNFARIFRYGLMAELTGRF